MSGALRGVEALPHLTPDDTAQVRRADPARWELYRRGVMSMDAAMDAATCPHTPPRHAGVEVEV